MITVGCTAGCTLSHSIRYHIMYSTVQYSKFSSCTVQVQTKMIGENILLKIFSASHEVFCQDGGGGLGHSADPVLPVGHLRIRYTGRLYYTIY